MQHNQSVEQSAKLHAAQVRARLFNQPKPKPIARIAYVAPVAPVIEEPKETIAPAAPEKGAYPSWRYGLSRYNQHMVDFREWQKQQEQDWEQNPFSHRSMLEITAETLEAHPGVTLGDLKGSHRARDIVLPRMIAMYRIRHERPDLSYPVIGRFFGGRDHTTVMHAIKKIEKMVNEGLL